MQFKFWSAESSRSFQRSALSALILCCVLSGCSTGRPSAPPAEQSPSASVSQPPEKPSVPEREDFEDIMGLPAWCERHDFMGDFWCQKTYFAQIDGSICPIGQSWGALQDEDQIVDLDGDGVSELVCSCTSGGDGHQSVAVYQRRGSQVWEGRIDFPELSDWDNWGVNSAQERFDPEDQTFHVTYDAADGGSRDWSCSFRQLRFSPWAPNITVWARGLFLENAPFVMEREDGSVEEMDLQTYMAGRENGRLDSYAMLDLDGNGVCELAAYIRSDQGVSCLVLHREDGQVLGNELRAGRRMELKEDGSYCWYESDSCFGCFRITQVGPDGIHTDHIYNTMDGQTFYVRWEEVSREVFDAAAAEQQAKPNAVFLFPDTLNPDENRGKVEKTDEGVSL